MPPEAQDLLVNVLANTANYKDALSLYESLPNKSENNKRILPRILYNRAQELLNDRQANAADALLVRAEKSRLQHAIVAAYSFLAGAKLPTGTTILEMLFRTWSNT